MSNSHLRARLSERWTNFARVKRPRSPHSQVARVLMVWAVCRLDAASSCAWHALRSRLGQRGSRALTQITRRHKLGFALTFYTEEGQCDLVGNNTPLFFVRDPSNFLDCQAAA
jgi:hypothetical protein